jgi:APA family basic amino acid/polyamine antiporter
VQNVFMVLKIGAIAALVVCGLALVAPAAPSPPAAPPAPFSIAVFGAALVPVIFAYGGWQTASFVSGELRDPRRDLARGMRFGVLGVVALYLAGNFVCVRALGVGGLAASTAPASDVMRLALGENGVRFIAVGIALSTLGFLSQSMLTAPRVYYAMAGDGLFFERVGWLDPRTQAPVVAIVLQGALASIIAASGRYEQILNYVVSVDAIAFGLTALALFVFRRRDRATGTPSRHFVAPGHPWTTLFFVAVSWLLAIATVYTSPANSAVGLAIVLAGVPVYYLWRGRRA